MTYELFTKLLSSIGDYQKSIDKAKSKLEVLEYAETGVKGISYTKTPLSHNPSLSALKRLDSIEEIDELEREINSMSEEMKNFQTKTDEVMKRMPEKLREMLTDKYIYGLTYIEMGDKYGYSNAGIWHKLRDEAEKYL